MDNVLKFDCLECRQPFYVIRHKETLKEGAPAKCPYCGKWESVLPNKDKVYLVETVK